MVVQFAASDTTEGGRFGAVEVEVEVEVEVDGDSGFHRLHGDAR